MCGYFAHPPARTVTEKNLLAKNAQVRIEVLLHMKLQVNPLTTPKNQVNGPQTVHLSQVHLLPGAQKTWATSGLGRLSLIDTYPL